MIVEEAIAPDETNSVPSDVSDVRLAVPPERTSTSPPLSTLVSRTVPPLSTNRSPPFWTTKPLSVVPDVTLVVVMTLRLGEWGRAMRIGRFEIGAAAQPQVGIPS